jgi:hypothetical protein
MSLPEQKIDVNKHLTCKCGGKFTYKNRLAHEKTLKHLEYLKSPVNFIKQNLLVDYESYEGETPLQKWYSYANGCYIPNSVIGALELFDENFHRYDDCWNIIPNDVLFYKNKGEAIHDATFQYFIEKPKYSKGDVHFAWSLLTFSEQVRLWKKLQANILKELAIKDAAELAKKKLENEELHIFIN